MASAIARSALRSALRGSATSKGPAPSKRAFSSKAHHDEAAEASKWEKITYVAIAACTVLSIYNLSKSHHHNHDRPAYSYLHIRNKEFPWGPDGLFEEKHH